MIKFIIPVIDTESGNYNYDGELSQEAYFGMIQDRVNRTNSTMNQFVNNYQRGIINRGNTSIYDSQNVKDEDIKYVFSESEALVMDSNNNEIDEGFLMNQINSGKKFILKININPDKLESDAESEIRYWMDDSDMVLTDIELDQKTKIISLPQRDFIIDMATDENEDAGIYQILGCKILQIYPQKQTSYPFYFAMMVEKIIKQ